MRVGAHVKTLEWATTLPINQVFFTAIKSPNPSAGLILKHLPPATGGEGGGYYIFIHI